MSSQTRKENPYHPRTASAFRCTLPMNWPIFPGNPNIVTHLRSHQLYNGGRILCIPFRLSFCINSAQHNGVEWQPTGKLSTLQTYLHTYTQPHRLNGILKIHRKSHCVIIIIMMLILCHVHVPSQVLMKSSAVDAHSSLVFQRRLRGHCPSDAWRLGKMEPERTTATEKRATTSHRWALVQGKKRIIFVSECVCVSLFHSQIPGWSQSHYHKNHKKEIPFGDVECQCKCTQHRPLYRGENIGQLVQRKLQIGGKHIDNALRPRVWPSGV